MPYKSDYYSYREFCDIIRQNNLTSILYSKFRNDYDGELLLPVNPAAFYKNEWISWKVARDCFKPRPTYQKICEIIYENQLTSRSYCHFRNGYTGEFNLPATPNSFYPEWVGWEAIAQGKRVATWKEFSAIVKKHNLSQKNYKKKREELASAKFYLPKNPKNEYKKFKSFSAIKGRVRGNPIIYEEFCRIIRDNPDYGDYSSLRKKLQKQGVALPFHPERVYPEFEGFPVILSGDTAQRCLQYQAFCEALTCNNITSQQYDDFRVDFNENSERKLPLQPDLFYNAQWEGWKVAQGQEKGKPLADYETFCEIAKKNKLTKDNYLGAIRRIACDVIMPDIPEETYDSWVDWFEVNGIRQYAPFDVFRKFATEQSLSSNHLMYKLPHYLSYLKNSIEV